MSYRPREFWEQRLAEQFDLRGTGETGLSLAYNRACYALRAEVLSRALRAAGVRLEGARVTGVDIASTSVERLRARARAGRPLRWLVPDAVAAYVARHGLYKRRGR